MNDVPRKSKPTPNSKRPRARYPTPEERDEQVAIPLEYEDAVKGLLAVDPDAPEPESGSD